MEFYSCLFGFLGGTLVGMILVISSFIERVQAGKDFTFINGKTKWVERKIETKEEE